MIQNKTIHYIWLGNHEKSRLIKKCIKSWEKYMPGWEIREWNEQNLNLDICPYCREAYDAGKFAFASDVLRFSVLEQHGGLYLDVDVELKKSLEPILSMYDAFTGFEYTDLTVNPGLILYVSQPNHPIIREMRKSYLQEHFQKDETIPQTVCERMSGLLKARGFRMDGTLQTRDDFTLFPATYFCPTNQIWSVQKFSENTYSIHHYGASWLPGNRKAAFIRFVCKIIGPTGITCLKTLSKWIRSFI